MNVCPCVNEKLHLCIIEKDFLHYSNSKLEGGTLISNVMNIFQKLKKKCNFKEYQNLFLASYLHLEISDNLSHSGRAEYICGQLVVINQRQTFQDQLGLRPKQKICLFPVICPRMIGQVGKIFFFCFFFCQRSFCWQNWEENPVFVKKI